MELRGLTSPNFFLLLTLTTVLPQKFFSLLHRQEIFEKTFFFSTFLDSGLKLKPGDKVSRRESEILVEERDNPGYYKQILTQTQ